MRHSSQDESTDDLDMSLLNANPWTPSMATSSVGNPDQLRTFINLTNGMKMLVIISQNATIYDLSIQSIRQAVQYGIHWRLDDTFIQTVGGQPIVFDRQHSVLDVLDLTRENTFSLCSSKQGSSSTSFQASIYSLDPKGLVFVRWITLQDALT